MGEQQKPLVRRVSEGDESVFLELVDALADYEKLKRPSAEAKQRLIRDGFGDRPLFTPYLVELEGRTVGYAITFFTYSSFLAQPTLYLEDVYVLPEARGRGVGRAVFQRLASEAVAHDCGRMDWVVLDWNRVAIDFYDHLGAQPLREWVGYRLDREQLETLASSSR
ncbi:GNAT family N-acetyltransferase [soil metagenome]